MSDLCFWRRKNGVKNSTRSHLILYPDIYHLRIVISYNPKLNAVAQGDFVKFSHYSRYNGAKWDIHLKNNHFFREHLCKKSLFISCVKCQFEITNSKSLKPCLWVNIFFKFITTNIILVITTIRRLECEYCWVTKYIPIVALPKLCAVI